MPATCAIDDDVEDRPALGGPSRRRPGQRGSSARSASSRGPPTATSRPSTVAARPATGERLEASAAGPSSMPRCLGASHDRPGERVLRVGLDGRGEAEDALDVHRVRRDVGEDRLALVRVPGLVEDDDVELRARSSARRSLTSSPFRAPSEVEMAMTSGMARPRAWGQAMTRTVAVRTSAPSGSPRSHQHDEGDRAGGEGDVEQERGGPVRERLRPRRRGLGRATRRMIPDRAVARRGGDPDAQRAARGDRAGDHRVAGLLGTARTRR